MVRGFWQDKIVVVSGGSTGLGFCLAREFLMAGSTVILWARDPQRLMSAKADLLSAGALGDPRAAGDSAPIVRPQSDSGEISSRVQIRSVDVTDESQVAAAIRDLIQAAGRIDVLVNSVGVSTRHSVDQAAPSEFRDLMSRNFLSAVNCTQLLLPELLRVRGQVIHIGSLAGRTPWPYLAGYVTSKAALAAYGSQLRLELAGRLRVLMVYPGPLRRDDAGRRYAASAGSVPSAALQPGAGAPVPGIDPQKLAAAILKAAQQGRHELVWPWKANLLFKLLAVCPRWGHVLLQRLARKSQAAR